MMKFNLIIVSLIFSFSSAAQSVISSAGDEASYTSWTIGEIVTEAITRSDAIIVQGFNQPFDISATGVINILNGKVTIQAYPNPVVDRLELVTETNELSSWLLYSLDGKILSSGQINDKNAFVDFSDKVPGLYILHIENQTNNQSILITKQNHP